jgi:hypothetical protein
MTRRWRNLQARPPPAPTGAPTRLPVHECASSWAITSVRERSPASSVGVTNVMLAFSARDRGGGGGTSDAPPPPHRHPTGLTHAAVVEGGGHEEQIVAAPHVRPRDLLGSRHHCLSGAELGSGGVDGGRLGVDPRAGPDVLARDVAHLAPWWEGGGDWERGEPPAAAGPERWHESLVTRSEREGAAAEVPCGPRIMT